MFSVEIHEFLLANPFPSLSYLPVLNGEAKEEVLFFLQDTAPTLRKISTARDVTLKVYREGAALILRILFPLQKETLLQTPRQTTWKRENEEVFYETEFITPVQKEAIALLSRQRHLTLVFFDRGDFLITRQLLLSDAFRDKLISFLDT